MFLFNVAVVEPSDGEQGCIQLLDIFVTCAPFLHVAQSCGIDLPNKLIADFIAFKNMLSECSDSVISALVIILRRT